MKDKLEKFMSEFGKEFLRLLEESVLVQSTVTLIAVGVTAYLVLCGADVPREWWAMMGIIIGFWFGSKVQIAERTGRKEEASRMADMAKIVKGEDC